MRQGDLYQDKKAAKVRVSSGDGATTSFVDLATGRRHSLPTTKFLKQFAPLPQPTSTV